VVVKLKNKTSEPSQKLLHYAAGLAAFYSNQRHEEYAEVIYTQRRWVQKVRKHAGMVKLVKEKTITIKTPSEKQLRIAKDDI
jgi:predicted ribosome quality control (RQC) complex YloA/Tae2 family protein